MAVKLNCDLGEGLDQVDRRVMPLIDQASIACGGHTGDYNSMSRAVALAKRHQVSIGAHPSYPDPDNFGRVSKTYDLHALQDALLAQIHALEVVCAEHDTPLTYIKAHGALYNDSNKNPRLAELLIDIAQSKQCPLMVQAHPNHIFREAAQTSGVEIIREGFADRAYNDDYFLVPRSHPQALLASVADIVKQAECLLKAAAFSSLSGKLLNLSIDSLCIHGDNALAIQALEKIHALRHRNHQR